MANHHGDFIWYELVTSDVDAAASFYDAVLGWKAHPAASPAPDYRIFGTESHEVGGMMALPSEDARPAWIGYVGVDDVDAMATKIVDSGGKQHVPPTDIPGIGRFAMVADPQGVVFYVMRGSVDDASMSFAPTKTGHCHWNELATSDPSAAFTFYSTHFGWSKGEAMPMGPEGTYQILEHHGQAFGAVSSILPQDTLPPRWTFYFGVDDIDRVAKIVTDKGGKVYYGPADVPGGVFIVIATDPQGALFGLVGPRVSA